MKKFGKLTVSWSVLLLLPFLTSCAGNSGQNASLTSTDHGSVSATAAPPIDLFKSESKTAPRTSARAPLNQVGINRAIRNYRLSKKASKGPFHTIGADLNADGKAEALVLFTGEDWCTASGCTLTVFSPTQSGYKPMTTIRRVKAPVKTGKTFNLGWRSLFVTTGGGAFEQNVELVFSGRGYPGNAARMTRLPNGVGHDAETLIAKSANPARKSNAVAEAPQPLSARGSH